LAAVVEKRLSRQSFFARRRVHLVRQCQHDEPAELIHGVRADEARNSRRS